MASTRRRDRLARRGISGAAAVLLVATGMGVADEVRQPDLDASGIAAYCSLALDIDRLSRPAGGYETLPNEEQFRIAKQLAEIAEPLVEALHTLADPAVEEETGLMLEGVEEVARTGGFRILGLRGGQSDEEDARLGERAAEISQAIRDTHAYNVDTCRWRRVDVEVGDDYFAGMPETIEDGLVSFEFANRGAKPHEMNVQRLHGGVELDDLMAQAAHDDVERMAVADATEEEVDQVDFRSGATTHLGESFAPAGKDDYLVLDLTPGRYVLICFVPDGTIYEGEMNESLGDGPAHAFNGMVVPFEVR